MIAHGGKLDPYDLVWLNEDDEVMRRVTEDPESASCRVWRRVHRGGHAREARLCSDDCSMPASR